MSFSVCYSARKVQYAEDNNPVSASGMYSRSHEVLSLSNVVCCFSASEN